MRVVDPFVVGSVLPSAGDEILEMEYHILVARTEWDSDAGQGFLEWGWVALGTFQSLGSDDANPVGRAALQWDEFFLNEDRPASRHQ